MRRYGKMVAAAVALVVATSAVGCGEESDTVAVDVSKDEKLLKAMGGYMEKRAGDKPASKKPAP